MSVHINGWYKCPENPRISCYLMKDEDGNKVANTLIINRALKRAMWLIQNKKNDVAENLLDDISIALEQII